MQRVAYVYLEYASPWGLFGERDVDSLLETSSDGRVQPPGDVSCPQHQNPVIVHPHPLHLHQELCLDAPRGVVFRVRARTAEGVHLVDEDDGWFACPGHFEEVFHESLALPEPLGDQVGGGDGEEG